MNQVLKLDCKAENVFFSSDFHLGHKREFVWQARGYSSPEEHTKALIEKVNSKVGANDSLLYLGDFCLNSSPEDLDRYLDGINCRNIFMLWGNHNNPLERIYKNLVKQYVGDIATEIYPLRWGKVIFVGNYLETIIENQIIVMSHYPMRVWNHMSHGSWMLSGHSHYNDIERHADWKQGKSLDVGWDGLAAPYSFEEIKKIMDTKELFLVDHHQ
jgi:calcineurin-like phosphoesterase family protein